MDKSSKLSVLVSTGKVMNLSYCWLNWAYLHYLNVNRRRGYNAMGILQVFWSKCQKIRLDWEMIAYLFDCTDGCEATRLRHMFLYALN